MTCVCPVVFVLVFSRSLVFVADALLALLALLILLDLSQVTVQESSIGRVYLEIFLEYITQPT